MPTYELCGGDNSNIVAASANLFWGVPGTGRADVENEVRTKVFDTYTLQNLFIRVITNATTADSTVRSRKNNLNGAQSVTIAGGATGVFEDTANSDSLVSGDYFALNTVAGAGGDLTFTAAGFLLVTASSTIPIFASQAQHTPDIGTVRYAGIGGTPTSTDTETQVQYTFRSSSTLSNLVCFIGTNTATAASTFAARINTVSSALTLSIASSTTGEFQNTADTASVVAGDEVNYIFDTTGSTGVLRYNKLQMQSNSAALQLICGFDSQSFSADRYLTPGGGINSLISTQSQSQHKARVAFTARDMFVNVILHGASGGVNIYLQQAGANTALTVSVAQNTTGIFEDTTNAVSIASGDLFNYFVDHGGGAGSITPFVVGMAMIQAGLTVPEMIAAVAGGLFTRIMPPRPVMIGY